MFTYTMRLLPHTSPRLTAAAVGPAVERMLTTGPSVTGIGLSVSDDEVVATMTIRVSDPLVALTTIAALRSATAQLPLRGWRLVPDDNFATTADSVLDR